MANSPDVVADTNIGEVGAPEEYSLFDWNGSELPSDMFVQQIPEPGVLIAIRRRPPNAKTLPLNTVAKAIRVAFQDRTEVAQYLSSDAARYKPEPYTTIDVFISHSTQDEAVVSELRHGLEERELACFISARDIRAGQAWKDEIRTALRQSKVVLILLTPNSVRSDWVMSEAGASWALEKSLVPAYMSIKLDDLPELLRDRQCRRVDTISDRAELIDEVARLCRP